MKKILIIGGNRFFGLHLAKELIADGHDVTLLNRGNLNDGLGSSVKRLIADRDNELSFKAATENTNWDIVYDQICYTATQAYLAIEIFKNKTKRYIVTSSESVFDYGENQVEENFNPNKYSFNEVADPKTNYQEAKRQVEVVFSSVDCFETVIVRPSLVVGVDDYTGRLKWHLDRVSKKLPLYFPNLEISSDFIRSDQAGLALKIIGLSGHCGPINLTTPGAVTMKKLISFIEDATNQKAIIIKQEAKDASSPYGGSQTKTMNTELLQSLGFNASPSMDWMPGLCSEMTKPINLT